MLCAAIIYCECQNAPSKPFIIQLDCDNKSLEQAIAEAFISMVTENECELDDVTVGYSENDDWHYANIGDEWLIVSIPK